MSKSRGFTLIELVVVIVILGILAAFAVPRLSNLDRQARASSVRALEGSIRAASAMAHGTWLAMGTSPGTVAVEGGTVTMTNGYPAAANNGIRAALDQSIFRAGAGGFVTAINNGAIEFRINGATNAANCMITYRAPATLGAAPTIVNTLNAGANNSNSC